MSFANSPRPDASAALLTSTGVGAVAVIEVCSANHEHVDQLFSAFTAVPERRLTDSSVGRIVYGHWGGEDVVIVRADLGRWEVHCHGGVAAVERILTDLQQQGVRVDRGGSACGKASGDHAIEATITLSLLKCRTPKTAGLVLAQLDGRLDRLLKQTQSMDSADRNAAADHIRRWQSVAEHLTRAWRVGIVGPPNAGKSSLINSLAGLQRSIVSNIPGTTRDLVEVEIIVDGWTFQLVDTAGIREVADSVLEGIGIEQSLEMLTECDLVCVVIDSINRMLPEVFQQHLGRISVPVCVLFNKCDLMTGGVSPDNLPSANQLAVEFPVAATFAVSAVTEEGLGQFLSWMVKSLISEEPTSEIALPLFCESFARL